MVRGVGQCKKWTVAVVVLVSIRGSDSSYVGLLGERERDRDRDRERNLRELGKADDEDSHAIFIAPL